MAVGNDVARQLAEVARQLHGASDVTDLLTRAVGLAVATVEGGDHASISLVTKGNIEAQAHTSDWIAEIIDGIRSDTGEGPCVDAIREHEVVETGDLSKEYRWFRFSTQVVERTGVRSVLCLRLFIDKDTLGTFSIYAKAVEAFDDADHSVASIFAAHTAVALRSAQREEQLITAIKTREIIGQAKGILMARKGIDETAAFAILMAASSRMNLKLREVAKQLVDREQHH